MRPFFYRLTLIAAPALTSAGCVQHAALPEGSVTGSHAAIRQQIATRVEEKVFLGKVINAEFVSAGISKPLRPDASGGVLYCVYAEMKPPLTFGTIRRWQKVTLKQSAAGDEIDVGMFGDTIGASILLGGVGMDTHPASCPSETEMMPFPELVQARQRARGV